MTRMRIGAGILAWLALLALLVLSALSPAPGKAAPAPTPSLILNEKGLAWTGGQVTFGMPRTAAVTAVSKAIRAPVQTINHADCGQGAPMTEVVFRGSLSMLFLKGRFSGWTVGMDDGQAYESYRTAKGIHFLSTRKALKAAYPKVEVDESSLGLMFTAEGAPSGFLNEKGDTVLSFFAGETCMIS